MINLGKVGKRWVALTIVVGFYGVMLAYIPVAIWAMGVIFFIIGAAIGSVCYDKVNKDVVK